MTKLHKIFFFFWKLKVWILGLRKGALVKVYSEDKNKWIKGAITGIVGCSVTRSKYDFSFQISFFEPIQGNDARFFSRSYLTEQELREKLQFV